MNIKSASHNILSSLRCIAPLIALLCCHAPVFGWNKKGHQIVAYIAQRHMTGETYSSVISLLDGDTPTYVAPWLDSARYTDEYAYTATWHYLDVEPGETYETRYREPGGDVVTAIEWAGETLDNLSSTHADKQLALKVVIHVIGDMHQPMHMGHRSDAGGNGTRIYYEDEATNLHALWDYTVLENTHNWSYYEWQRGIDTRSDDENAVIVSGSIHDWAKENLAVANRVYAAFPKGCRITAGDLDVWGEEVELRLLSGGLRLAHWLNTMFDKSYDGVPVIYDDLTPDTTLTDVYTLTGVCVRRAVPLTEATDGLTPGFYIINHKKVIIK